MKSKIKLKNNGTMHAWPPHTESSQKRNEMPVQNYVFIFLKHIILNILKNQPKIKPVP